MATNDDVPAPLPYQGPSYDPSTGRFGLGSWQDGERLYWQLNTPGQGVNHGLIIGDPGMGKTSLLRLIGIEVIQAGRFLLWIIGPDGRRTLEPLEPGADWLAYNHEETRRLLEAAVTITRAPTRSAGPVDPVRERPGVIILIDDAHLLFGQDPAAMQLAETATEVGGPAGVGIIAAFPGIPLHHFGGSKRLRSALGATNAVSLTDAATAAELRQILNR